MRVCCFGFTDENLLTTPFSLFLLSLLLLFSFSLFSGLPSFLSQQTWCLLRICCACRGPCCWGTSRTFYKTRKWYRIRINDASLIELDGLLMVVRHYRPADGFGLVAGASGSILGGSTSLLAPFPSGVTLGLSDVTLLGLRLPSDKDGLLGDRGIDAGGGGDLDFLGLGVFWGGLVVEPLTNRQQQINRWAKSSL